MIVRFFGGRSREEYGGLALACLWVAGCSSPSPPLFSASADTTDASETTEDGGESESTTPSRTSGDPTSSTTSAPLTGMPTTATASEGSGPSEGTTDAETGGETTSGGPGSTTWVASIGSLSSAESDDGSSSGFDTDNTEVCDGLDNDGNGIIDDLDIGEDGVCDCIRIATLGLAGQWGNGDVFAEWLSTRAVQGAAGLADQVLTPELLEPYQVIVVQNVSTIGRTYDDDEIAALQAWVEGGGGLMTLIGYAGVSELENVNLLLEPFDLRYLPQAILPKSGGVTVPISEWQTHPVTAEVMAVGVDNGYPVEGQGLVYAQEQGFDVGIAAEQGDGRISVWGDEWITYDSEWIDRQEYQVELFWLNTIKWLTPPLECQVVVPVPS